MPIEASRFVLGEHQNFTKVAIEAVGKREIDDAIKPAKGTAGFARSLVRGSRRVPLPPARIRVSTSRKINPL